MQPLQPNLSSHCRGESIFIFLSCISEIKPKAFCGGRIAQKCLEFTSVEDFHHCGSMGLGYTFGLCCGQWDLRGSVYLFQITFLSGKKELLKWLETPFIWNFLLELCLVQFCNTVCALHLTGGLLLPAEQDAKFHTEVCFLLEFVSPGNPKCKNVSSLSSVFALNVSKGRRCRSSQCWQQGPSSG